MEAFFAKVVGCLKNESILRIKLQPKSKDKKDTKLQTFYSIQISYILNKNNHFKVLKCQICKERLQWFKLSCKCHRVTI